MHFLLPLVYHFARSFPRVARTFFPPLCLSSNYFSSSSIPTSAALDSSSLFFNLEGARERKRCPTRPAPTVDVHISVPCGMWRVLFNLLHFQLISCNLISMISFYDICLPLCRAFSVWAALGCRMNSPMRAARGSRFYFGFGGFRSADCVTLDRRHSAASQSTAASRLSFTYHH